MRPDEKMKRAKFKSRMEGAKRMESIPFQGAEEMEYIPLKGVEEQEYTPLEGVKMPSPQKLQGIRVTPPGKMMGANMDMNDDTLSADQGEILNIEGAIMRPKGSGLRGEVELFGPTETREYSPVSKYLMKKKGKK